MAATPSTSPAPIVVRLDPAQVEEIQAVLAGVEKGFEKAMQGALSRTLTTGRARIAKTLYSEVNLRVADIKDQITLKRPSFKKLEGSISMSRKAVPLIQYLNNRQKTSKTKTPLKVKVRKRNQLAKYPETVQKGFVQAMPNSPHIGVFQRVGVKRVMKSGRYAGRVREIISRLYGPTAIGVFANARGEKAGTLVDDEVANLGEDLAKYAGQRVDYLLMKANPPSDSADQS